MDKRPVVSRETVSLAALLQQGRARLASVFPLPEAQAILRRLLSHYWPGWEAIWLATRGAAPFPPEKLSAWQAALHRLAQGEPLAYVLGEVEFGGLSLKVAPGVFIPRPETEEWAFWVARQLTALSPRTVLDVGTGSGALALFLARAFPSARVFAVDKSPLALSIAAQNAERLGLAVQWALRTFGLEPLPADWPTEWDLIVSNPPYIPWTFWDQTEPRVRSYEPPEALFCRDFSLYAKLGAFASSYLSEKGLLVCEIFPPYADEIKNNFERLGFKVHLYCDFQGRARWVVAYRGEFFTFAPASGSSSAR